MGLSCATINSNICDTGIGHQTLDGRLLPLSVLNVVDADLAIPYDVNDLFRELPPPLPQPGTRASNRRHIVASNRAQVDTYSAHNCSHTSTGSHCCTHLDLSFPAAVSTTELPSMLTVAPRLPNQ